MKKIKIVFTCFSLVFCINSIAAATNKQFENKTNKSMEFRKNSNFSKSEEEIKLDKNFHSDNSDKILNNMRKIEIFDLSDSEDENEKKSDKSNKSNKSINLIYKRKMPLKNRSSSSGSEKYGENKRCIYNESPTHIYEQNKQLEHEKEPKTTSRCRELFKEYFKSNREQEVVLNLEQFKEYEENKNLQNVNYDKYSKILESSIYKQNVRTNNKNFIKNQKNYINDENIFGVDSYIMDKQYQFMILYKKNYENFLNSINKFKQAVKSPTLPIRIVRDINGIFKYSSKELDDLFKNCSNLFEFKHFQNEEMLMEYHIKTLSEEKQKQIIQILNGRDYRNFMKNYSEINNKIFYMLRYIKQVGTKNSDDFENCYIKLKDLKKALKMFKTDLDLVVGNVRFN